MFSFHFHMCICIDVYMCMYTHGCTHLHTLKPKSSSITLPLHSVRQGVLSKPRAHSLMANQDELARLLPCKDGITRRPPCLPVTCMRSWVQTLVLELSQQAFYHRTIPKPSICLSYRRALKYRFHWFWLRKELKKTKGPRTSQCRTCYVVTQALD